MAQGSLRIRLVSAQSFGICADKIIEKTYGVASEIVEIEDVGPVKIVASKTDDTTRHYLSTDLGRSAAGILELVEHRWNIETVHKESNAKFGFKQYQLEGKQAIERYLQLVFLAWTLVTLAERANVAFWEERGGLSVRLDHAKQAYLVETLLEITEEVRSEEHTSELKS